MSNTKGQDQHSPDPHPWIAGIPDDQWLVYQRVIRLAKEAGIPFALGGAFAVATYTGLWRNTKDLDLYILPADRERVVKLATNLGLKDYFTVLPYQQHWIYRAYQDEIIVDFIWAMANDWDQVDEDWLNRGPVIQVRGEELRIMSPEELISAKLYVLQKDRCDWPDIFNILYATGVTLDWEQFDKRLAQDLPLLRAALSVFAWLSPGRAQEFPQEVWEHLGLPEPDPVPSPDEAMQRRANRLDSRPWFIPVLSDE